MEKRLWLLTFLGVFLTCAAPVVATFYTWTRGGSDLNWVNSANWDQAGYPWQSTDDAKIVNPGCTRFCLPWQTIHLAQSKTIDELIIETCVVFDPASATATLTVGSLTINGGTGGVTAEVTGNTTIQTNNL